MNPKSDEGQNIDAALEANGAMTLTIKGLKPAGIESVDKLANQGDVNVSALELDSLQANFDVPADHTDDIRLRVEGWSILVNILAIANTKSPMMDSATNDVAIKIPMRQRGTGVWTRVVECKEFTADIEQTNRPIIDHKHPRFTIGDLIGLANVMKV